MRCIVIRVYIYFGSSPPNFLKIEVYLLLGVSYSEVRISKPVRRLEVYKLDELADKKWIEILLMNYNSNITPLDKSKTNSPITATNIL